MDSCTYSSMTISHILIKSDIFRHTLTETWDVFMDIKIMLSKINWLLGYLNILGKCYFLSFQKQKNISLPQDNYLWYLWTNEFVTCYIEFCWKCWRFIRLWVYSIVFKIYPVIIDYITKNILMKMKIPPMINNDERQLNHPKCENMDETGG